MLASELIERKRDGEELEAADLRAFLDGFQAGEVADYQMSALLMAVYFQGLSTAELTTLTRAMIESGRRLDFRRPGAPPAVDKHSTGGVGDKVSLVLAPLLAVAGVRVPMMSGRGLGHTGGTLDKLESIPGFRTDIDLEAFARIVDEVGCAMVGQSPDLTPLDGRLYALRDVTGTVPSMPLIASSIVSKKVAEGIEALVLDVTCGDGAFMRREEGALALARTLVELAGREGLAATALVTGMEAPLGRAVGNALEVREAIDCLHGRGPADLEEVTLALATELPGVVREGEDREEARGRLSDLLRGGTAARRFAELIERQGGDPSVVEEPDRLPAAPVRVPWRAPASGWVHAVGARQVGLAAVELGAGRRRMGQPVDPAVGIELRLRPGDDVEEGAVAALVHARSESDAHRAMDRLGAAVRIGPARPAPGSAALRWESRRVRYRVTPQGVEPIG
jgi:pyrimidine-nucleoside phosphorylase